MSRVTLVTETPVADTAGSMVAFDLISGGERLSFVASRATVEMFAFRLGKVLRRPPETAVVYRFPAPAKARKGGAR